MKRLFVIAAVALFGILPAAAQSKYIGMKRAKQIALTHARGTIKSSELEKEHGKMIYSFDIRNSRGKITEVNIDARTGKLIAVEHETPKDEKREKKEEMKEKH